MGSLYDGSAEKQTDSDRSNSGTAYGVNLIGNTLFLRIPREAESWTALAEHARAGEVDYIVVDRRWSCRAKPWLHGILDGKQPHDGATSVFRWTNHPPYEVEVFTPGIGVRDWGQPLNN